MKNLFKLSIQKRWVITSVFIALALFGYYSWTQLSIEAYPDIADVTSQVVTHVPGLAAEEIEQQITIPLERALNGLPGMHVMRSNSTFGLSLITIVFEDGIEDHWSRMRIQERLNEVELPYDAVPELDPLTSPIGEIYRYIVVSDRHTLREISDLQHWVIIPRLREISGVVDVENFGGITTQFHAEICPNKLLQFDLSLADVVEAIEENNANAGGSIINRGNLMYVIRGVGLVRSLEDIGNIAIMTEGGVPVFVRDVATMRYGEVQRVGVLGFTDRERDLSETIGGIVLLLRHENPSRVLEGVHQAVFELNNGLLPEGVEIITYLDRTELIDTTIRTVGRTMSRGVLLVIIALIVFLGSWRGALLVAMTIPLSLLISFIMMNFFGIPANLLSLGAIDFGIIVDGAIVMTESILKKRENNPKKYFDEETLIKRMASVGRPILFAVIIMITAYIPLFAFERVEYKLFTPMAFTMGFALLGSLLVALILIPGVAYAIYRKPQKVYRNRWLERLTKTYSNSVNKLILKPVRVIVTVIVVFIGAIALSINVGKDFLPRLDEGSIWLQVKLPPGITLEKSRQISDTLRARTMQFPEITYIAVQAGRNDGGTDPFTPSHFEVSIGLKPYREWPRGKRKNDLINQLDAEFATIPGILSVGFTQPMIDGIMDKIAGAHSELVVKIFGNDLIEGRKIAENVLHTLREVRGAVDLAIKQEPPLPQMQINIDRMAIARHGLTVNDVTEFIEIGIGGRPISEVWQEDRVFDITARFREETRNTPERIGNLRVTSPTTGAHIPLAQLADIVLTTGESTISRQMNRRHVTVQLNLRERDLSSFLREAKRAIEQNVEYDPSQFRIEWGGQFENQRRAFSRLAVIVPMTLLLMFLLLYGAFGRARQAALVLIVVPLAIFGGMLALNVRGMTFNVSSAVGFIALFGLAITNGILLITHINNLRKDGLSLMNSVKDGARHRFRPILMTSTVAILGLFPASIATDIGSDVQRPLATVIVYGLMFSVLLTLYVMPVFYYLMEAWKIRRDRRIAIRERSERNYYSMPKTFAFILGISAVSIFGMPTANALQQNNVANHSAVSLYEAIDFARYIYLVGQNNLGFMAERFNVKIAEAEAISQRVFPDPEFTIHFFDNDDGNIFLGRGIGFELEHEFELGRERRSRMRLARSEAEMEQILLRGAFEDLRAEAAIAFLESQKHSRLLQLRQESYEAMRQLFQFDSLRFVFGEISEVEMLQTRLETAQMLNEVFEQEAAFRSSMAELNVLAGRQPLQLLRPYGILRRPIDRDYTLGVLFQRAMVDNHVDLAVALQQKQITRDELRLTRSERRTNLGLSLTYDLHTETRELQPFFNTFSVGVTVPLRFSNFNRGNLRAAQFAVEQAEIEFSAMELEVKLELSQAFFEYESLKRQVNQFEAGMLDDARRIREGVVFSYKNGEARLIEVLDAIATFNELNEEYIETLFEFAAAVVELNRRAGIWEVAFSD